MKTLSSILFIMLIPLVLMGSFLSFIPNPSNPLIPMPEPGQRTWRINHIQQDNMYLEVWHESGHYQFVYSQSYPTRLDTLKYITYDSGTQTWTPFFVTSFTYDITNEYITGTLTKVYISGMEMPMSLSYNTYDSQHRLTFSLWESYNQGSQSWVMSRWTRIIYRSNTDYDVFNYSIGEESRPASWSKVLLTWDTQGRIVQEIEQESADSLNWVNTTQTIRTFHPHDATTGDIFVQNIAHYIPLQGVFYYLNASTPFGMVSEELGKTWNGSWVNSELLSYTYNTNDKLTEYLEQSWQGTWTNYTKREFTYNINQNMDEWTEYEFLGTAWEPKTRYTFTWGQDTSAEDASLPAAPTFGVTASPNPFNSRIRITYTDKTIKPAEINIYNLKGQLVNHFSVKANSSYVWDGSDRLNRQVPEGIYFLKADTGEQSRIIRVVRIKH